MIIINVINAVILLKHDFNTEKEERHIQKMFIVNVVDTLTWLKNQITKCLVNKKRMG